jgi:hypothetical protein
MLGRYLEALARGKACNVVSSLRNEQATTALLLSVGKSDCDTTSEQSVQEREMDVELIQPGDFIKVLTPGNDALRQLSKQVRVFYFSYTVCVLWSGVAWRQGGCRRGRGVWCQFGGRVVGHWGIDARG